MKKQGLLSYKNYAPNAMSHERATTTTCATALYHSNHCAYTLRRAAVAPQSTNVVERFLSHVSRREPT